MASKVIYTHRRGLAEDWKVWLSTEGNKLEDGEIGIIDSDPHDSPNHLRLLVGDGQPHSYEEMPKFAYAKEENGSVVSHGYDYAEYFKWADDVPEEYRTSGRFVTIAENTRTIRPAQPTDKVLGITSHTASIIGNWDEGSRNASDGWAIVGMLGIVEVLHDETCVENGYAMIGEHGIATHTEDAFGYKIVNVNNETGTIEVVLGNDSDMISRIKSELENVSVDYATQENPGIVRFATWEDIVSEVPDVAMSAMDFKSALYYHTTESLEDAPEGSTFISPTSVNYVQQYVNSKVATQETPGMVRFATEFEVAEALSQDTAVTPDGLNIGLAARLPVHCNDNDDEMWGGSYPPTSHYMREYVDAAVANSGGGGSINYATQEKAGIVRFATWDEMINYDYNTAITPFDFDLRLKDVTLQSITDKGVHPALPVSASAVWEYVNNISYNDLKDKPFYEEGEKGYSFIKDQEVGYSFIDWGAYTPTEGDIASTSDITEEIKANHTYILSIDGIENIVTCNGTYDDGMGETLVCDFVFDSSSIMRFEIMQKYDDKSIVMTLWLNIPGETHTISFYDPGDYTLSPLDEKFIPDSIARVDYVDAAIGDIDSALDELHTYAQALVNGGAE